MRSSRRRGCATAGRARGRRRLHTALRPSARVSVANVGRVSTAEAGSELTFTASVGPDCSCCALRCRGPQTGGRACRQGRGASGTRFGGTVARRTHDPVALGFAAAGGALDRQAPPIGLPDLIPSACDGWFSSKSLSGSVEVLFWGPSDRTFAPPPPAALFVAPIRATSAQSGARDAGLSHVGHPFSRRRGQWQPCPASRPRTPSRLTSAPRGAALLSRAGRGGSPPPHVGEYSHDVRPCRVHRSEAVLGQLLALASGGVDREPARCEGFTPLTDRADAFRSAAFLGSWHVGKLTSKAHRSQRG